MQLWQKKCLVTPIYIWEVLWFLLVYPAMQKCYDTAFKCHHLKACHYPKTNTKICFTEPNWGFQLKFSTNHVIPAFYFLLQHSEPLYLITYFSLNKRIKYKKKVSIFHSNATGHRTIPSSVIAFGILLYPWNSLM